MDTKLEASPPPTLKLEAKFFQLFKYTSGNSGPATKFCFVFVLASIREERDIAIVLLQIVLFYHPSRK